MEFHEHYLMQKVKARKACNKLVLTAIVSLIFCVSEAVGGTISGSLAILCDAAHQLSDVAGFVISFMAIYLTRKPATLQHTYGYHRADVIGALGSILIIWGLLVWLLSEAVKRLMNPQEINGEIMLITAIFGLGCNIMNLLILNCCCNHKDSTGRQQSVFESIASAYKPLHGRSLSQELRQKKRSNSLTGSVLSQRCSSKIDNTDADLESGDSLKPSQPKLALGYSGEPSGKKDTDQKY